MSPLSHESRNVKRRAVALARRHGHVPGPFRFFEDSPLGAGLASRCQLCGGQLLGLANGEVSVPRLCRARLVDEERERQPG